MSKKTIAAYFTVISRKTAGDSHPVSNNNEDKKKALSPSKLSKRKKRKQQILSDSEDEIAVVKQSSKKGETTNGKKQERDGDASTSKTPKKQPEPTKRSSKIRAISDSEDEAKMIEQKSKKPRSGVKDKVTPKKTISVADMFGSTPVKRIEAPKPKKKLLEEDDVELCLDKDFEATLNEVEKSSMGQHQPDKAPTGKTNGTENLNKISPKKDNTIFHKLSDSGESPNDKIKKVNSIGHIEKVTGDKINGSKFFQNATAAGKDEATKSSKTGENSKAVGSSKKTSHGTSYQKGISIMTIDKTSGNKRKRSTEDEEIDPFEAYAQKKKRSAALYQQYLHRGGARNPGSKEIPTGADNCLSGLNFVITGVLESLERDEATELIKKYGGHIMANVSVKTNYVIVGDDAGPSKLAKIKQLGINTISEDDLLEMIRTRSASQTKTNTKHANRKPKKSPQKSKEKIPEPKPLGSPEAENESKTNLQVLNNKSKTLSPEKTNSVQTTQDLKGNDILPVDRVPTEAESQVWVEKYKPKDMKQIIGQRGDKSNAQKLYNWLKNWQKNQSGSVKLTRPSPWAQSDGAFFKAALLSGPPGVGKTTTVQVVCNELQLDAVEFNASDTRSKRLLKEEVSELLNNKSMKGYFVGGDSKKPGRNHVLVMDEVDGMAGNEDRGGLQELIALIKTTNVPVICICNDRNHPKMRTLSNYTFDLKFQQPKIAQIKSAMMSVCYKEKINIAPEDLTRLIESTNNDIRQVLNHLSLLASNSTIDNTPRGKKCNKDFRLGPWEVVQKVFNHESHKTMSIHDKSDLFFHDYNIAPLFVQENYLGVAPKCPKEKILETVADAAESLALGDLIENAIRRSGAWTLLPTQACYSSVIPGTLMSGTMTKQISFPSWLGQNSRRTKFNRLIQEITMHTRLVTSSSNDAINLDYLKYLRDAIIRPLVTEGADGASAALNMMNHYQLLREDLDSLAEVSLWPGQRDPMQALDSKTKAAFTRAFNKSSVMRPYAMKKGAEKKKRAQTSSQEDLDFEEEEIEAEEDDDSPLSDPMIKVKKASAAGGKNTVSAAETGTSGTKKKSSNPRAGKSKMKN